MRAGPGAVRDGTAVLGQSHNMSRWTPTRAARRGQESCCAHTCHPCVPKARVLPTMQCLILECLWSLSRNSASICHIIEERSFIAAIKTFQMHYTISTRAKSPDHCLKSKVSDLSDAVVDLRGCLRPHPPTWDFSYFFHWHLTKQHNGLKVCLVLWLPLSHRDGKHSVANLKWLQAARLGGY